ncbi:MAG: type II toxin-antitoxin system VapC family toxin [Blastocatellales bacterium]
MANRIILLDTTPLGLATHPNPSATAIACRQWLRSHIARGSRVIVPEIADYELRRELLRANRRRGLSHLDRLIQQIEYLPLTTKAMRQAAQFWAQARQQGQPTAGDTTLDGDVILAAQAITLNESNVIVATANVKHIARFVPADLWQNIS